MQSLHTMDSLFAALSTRQLSATKVVPYSPDTAFAALADISSYERATSLIYASSISSKDLNGLPKTARLRVSYPALALNEEWTCRVRCDRPKRTLEISNQAGPEFDSYAVESHTMKWTVSPVPNDKSRARIRLDLEVKFKGPMVDSMFAVLPDVAGSIMDRFSALIGDRDRAERALAKKKTCAGKGDRPKGIES